jgi:hypothetical protein
MLKGGIEMTTQFKTVDDLLNWWPGNVPFKGKLISEDGSCMCAQGQVLHFVGGMSADDLRQIEQDEADKRVAKLMGISRAHAVLLRIVNDGQPGAPTCVIREPEKVLGPQAQLVLSFWRRLDEMTSEQWRDVTAAWAAAGDAARDVAWDIAWDAAAQAAAGDAAGDATEAVTVFAAAWAAAGDAAGASNEIQGAAVMRERGQPFFFLPMFGISQPEELDA